MSSKHFVITQGEHRATADPDAVISTLLGSCVACCLWDEVAGVGGMNHMLVTSRIREAEVCNLAGYHAMELLINSMLKLGAARHRLKAKAFGGAQMVSGLSNIGPANAEFVLSFLEREQIPCVAHSLGGTSARLVVFTPASGAARVKVQTAKVPEPDAPVMAAPGNGMELL